MNEETKKRNKIIGISIGILVVLLVVISSTYAYWQITRSQEDPNKIIAACLDINMQSVDGTFGLDPAWPISDSEGMQLEGYTFEITNNCPEDVNYIIGMDSLDVSGKEYLDYNNIRISIDNNKPITYGGQEDIEHIEEGDTYTIRDSKKLYTATVAGKVDDTPGKNTHNVKVWISSESLVEEQGRIFSGRMFITGGQKIENDSPLVTATEESCFEMDTETGTEIIGYDESCGERVVIPETVNSVAVKTIDTNAFRDEVLTEIYYGDDIDDSGASISSVNSVDVSAANVMFVFDNYQENTGMNLSVENIITNATYIVKLTSDAPVNATIDSTGEQYGVTNKVKDLNNIPELTENQIAIYANLDATFAGDILGGKYLKTEALISIKGLDLSLARYLERIEAAAFSNVDTSIVSEEDLEHFNDYPTSLTSLTFGENENKILIEDKAFARIDVDELTLYSSYVSPINQDYTTPYAFGGAIIDEMTIKPAGDLSTLTYDITAYEYNWYGGIVVNKLNIADGITAILHDAFQDASIGTLELPKSIFTNYSSNSGSGLGLATIGTIVLPDGITEIPESAFNNTKFTNITIPYTVTQIASNAFKHSKGTNIVFEDTAENPSQLITISNGAFRGSAITSITLPSSLETIDGNVFVSSALTSITIPSSVKTIGDSAFQNCASLTEVIFEDTTENPSQLTSIGLWAFDSTYKLGNVTIPGSITNIGQEAFDDSGSGTITIKMSEADFISKVTTGASWSGSYTVSYES